MKEQKPSGDYVTHNEFKKFIQSAKREVSSERDHSGLISRNIKSPIRIVNKLVEDANRRQKNKEEIEHLGRGPSFALTFGKWNSTLRAKSQQPSLQSRSQSRGALRTDSNYKLSLAVVKNSQVCGDPRNSSAQRQASAQRVKQMLERFETQEKLKQEILERERQLKKLESNPDEEETK